MKRSEGIGNLALALAKFQAEVTNPKNTSDNPMFAREGGKKAYRYASLDEVLSTIRPILGKCELSFIQDTCTEGDKVRVTTLLMHKSGEWIESEPLIFDAIQKRRDGSKEVNAQGAGSAITYARRYQLSALLGIASEDDDDGNEATGKYDDKEQPQQQPSNAQKKQDIEERAKQQAPAAQHEQEEKIHYCQSCASKGINKPISLKVAQISQSRYKMQLCMECQNLLKSKNAVAQE